MSTETPRFALVLAAGKGTRFLSEKPKVLHEVCGRPMICYLLDKLVELEIQKVFVVLGYGAEEVRNALRDYDLEFILQAEQLGTGHAVMAALPVLNKLTGSLLVLYGDTPLITVGTLRRLLNVHEEADADETLLTVRLEDPAGYGRIVRSSEGEVVDIVEQKEASPAQAALKEINAGFACFKIASLVDLIGRLSNRNRSGEYYLTDMVRILAEEGLKVRGVPADLPRELLGINDRAELAAAEEAMRATINLNHMRNGVTMPDAARVYVDSTVTLGPDCVLHPGVYIGGNSTIGRGCRILPHCYIENATLEPEVELGPCCVVRDSHVGKGSRVGPFAHLRSGTLVEGDARIGNFVELKNSRIGAASTAAHLSYLGDAKIGRNVNVGAGTITCNYDGERKHETVVEDGVFVGSGSQLVAPLTVHRDSLVAAGSTITEDVPPDSLAIARARQVNKVGWTKKRSNARSENKTG